MKKYISKDDIIRCINIVDIAEEFEIKLEDAASGSFNRKCICPSKEHKNGNERTGSLYIDTVDNNFWCFGCLPPDQEIWTAYDGLVPIKDIKVGDIVIDKNGQEAAVTNHIEKKVDERLLSFELANIHKHVLSFTENHTMLVCRNIHEDLNYFWKHSKTEEVKFNIQAKRRTAKKYSNKLRSIEVIAKDVIVGDYFMHPVIQSDLKINEIKNVFLKKYTKGVKNNRIDTIPINENTMWIFGLYCAEGSSYRGGIRFSMHFKEKHMLNRVAAILKEDLGLNSTIHEWEDKNGAELTCSNTDLEQFFKNSFGQGCQNKTAPAYFARLSIRLQDAFWNGVMDGNGSSDKCVLGITSYKLISLMQKISVNLMKPFSFSKLETSQTKKNVFIMRFYKNNSSNVFFEEVDGHMCMLQKVIAISYEELKTSVFDISVEKTNTFLCKDYIVHNCNAGKNVIDFYMICADLEFADALKILRERIDPSKATGTSRLPVQSSFGELLKISDLLRETMINHPSDLYWINILMQNIDQYIFDIASDDVDGAKVLFDKVENEILNRYKK